MLSAQGSVVLTHFDHGAAHIEVAASREAMVVQIIGRSLVAGWGSDRNLEALKRIRARLDEAIAEIEKEAAREVSNIVLEEAEEP